MLTTKYRQQNTNCREFHTFITLSLSAKKFLRTVFVDCVLYSLYAWLLVFDSVPNEKKIIKTHINDTKTTYFVILEMTHPGRGAYVLPGAGVVTVHVSTRCVLARPSHRWRRRRRRRDQRPWRPSPVRRSSRSGIASAARWLARTSPPASISTL